MFYRFISDLFEVLKSGDSDGPKRGTYGGASGDCFCQFSQCLKAFPAIWGWTGENSCHFSHISSHIISNSGHKNKKRSHEISKKCLKIWNLPQWLILPILWKSESTMNVMPRCFRMLIWAANVWICLVYGTLYILFIVN